MLLHGFEIIAGKEKCSILLLYTRVKNTLKVVIHQNLLLISLLQILVHYTPNWIVPGLYDKSKV